MSYVTIHEIDERPVYDRKTGERLAPHLVNVGRRSECEAVDQTLTVRMCADRVGSEARKSDVIGWTR